MLKGSIFDNQLYTDDVCATINHAFLNHKSGVISDYGEGFNVTISNQNLIIHSGMAIIQGRALYENATTTIEAPSQVSYCRIVIELDMSQTNDADNCNQISYKILTADTTYPTLTQNDLFTNQTGIYQFSLGRFQTTSNNINNYKDERTYIDFDGIYSEVENHIKSIDDNSALVLKTDLFNMIYPVGSIYISYTNSNPSTLFGGTWEQLKDRFLLSAGDTYKANATGGEATHKLTVNEMPNHAHGLKASNNTSVQNYYTSGNGFSWPFIYDPDGTSTNLMLSTGGNVAHNNMPPYIVVYVWRRTA